MSRSQSPQHRPSSDVKHHPKQPLDSAADSKDTLSRPQPLKARSNLDLEPNPFEQSFAPSVHPPSLHSSASSPIRRNSTVSVSSQSKSDSSVTSGPPRTPSSSSARTRDGSPPSPSKPILPPIESIASPSDQYPWGFSNSITNSLRAGPLSPAMLAGPQQANGDAPLSFDPSGFRTGLTPRTGMTPGTGLTPLIGGPVSFPPPSPNTTAFLNMMSSSASGATITPNTLNAITGVLTAGNAANGTNASQPHPLSVSHLPPSGYEQRPSNYTNGTPTQNGETRFSASAAANVASTAANGLFLLSQAHQELTKREKAQRAGRSDGDDDDEDDPSSNGAAKRGTKRKSYDVSASPPPLYSKPAPPKRSRALSNGRSKRGESISVEEDEEEEDEDEAATSPSDLSTPQMNGKKGGQKRPETEEEKRRNFLERNRQAALKCRQRKKAWLAQLQAKNEYLSQENQRLQEALVGAREEIARLTAGAPMLPVGVTANPPPNAHPVSVNVSLPAPNPKAIVSSRGYGY